MRVALVDALKERHIVDGLTEALRERGHEVHSTGLLSPGALPLTPKEASHLTPAYESVADFNPDLVIAFRPSALPAPWYTLYRRKGAKVFTWLSDDPVFLHSSYHHAVENSDLILHCGGTLVMGHYQHIYGRPTGVNFPFFVHPAHFPYVWQQSSSTADCMFLGNTNDSVRSGRLDTLTRLEATLSIFGRTRELHHEAYKGYLDTQEELVAAASKVTFAVSIPQRFSDYRGTPFWFEDLDHLGTFQTPSRLVQYSALGLPVVSISDHGKDGVEHFPTVIRCETVEDANLWWRQARNDPAQLRDLSLRGREHTIRHFSAASRARFLEALMDRSWADMTLTDRDLLYQDYPSEPAAPKPSADVARSPVYVNQRAGRSVTTIAVTGDGWTSPHSDLQLVLRTISQAGAKVAAWNPYNITAHISRTPSGPDELTTMPPGPLPERVLVIGDKYVISDPLLAQLRRLGIRVETLGLRHDAEYYLYSPVLSRTDQAWLTSHDVARRCTAHGWQNVQTASLDRGPTQKRGQPSQTTPGLGVITYDSKDISLTAPWLSEIQHDVHVISDGTGHEALASSSALSRELCVVLPTAPYGRREPSPWLGAVLHHAQGTVVSPRHQLPIVDDPVGIYLPGVESAQEARLRLTHLRTDPGLRRRLLERRLSLARQLHGLTQLAVLGQRTGSTPT